MGEIERERQRERERESDSGKIESTVKEGSIIKFEY